MSGKPQGIEINGAELNERIKSKFGNQKAFAEATGLAKTTLNDYCSEKYMPPLTNLKLMCLMLGCNEDDLKKKPVVPKETATSILVNAETQQMVDELLKEIHAFRNEMATLSKFVVDINKKVNEVHAQEQLNAEDMKAIHSKMAEINGNLTKIYAKTRKY